MRLLLCFGLLSVFAANADNPVLQVSQKTKVSSSALRFRLAKTVVDRLDVVLDIGPIGVHTAIPEEKESSVRSISNSRCDLWKAFLPAGPRSVLLGITNMSDHPIELNVDPVGDILAGWEVPITDSSMSLTLQPKAEQQLKVTAFGPAFDDSTRVSMVNLIAPEGLIGTITLDYLALPAALGFV